MMSARSVALYTADGGTVARLERAVAGDGQSLYLSLAAKHAEQKAPIKFGKCEGSIYDKAEKLKSLVPSVNGMQTDERERARAFNDAAAAHRTPAEMQFLGYPYGGATVLASMANLRDPSLEILTKTVVSSGTTFDCILPREQLEALQLRKQLDADGRPVLYRYADGFMQRYEDVLVTLYSDVTEDFVRQYPVQAKASTLPAYAFTERDDTGSARPNPGMMVCGTSLVFLSLCDAWPASKCQRGLEPARQCVGGSRGRAFRRGGNGRPSG
ncbi:hypothetical protein WJX72_005836 [[Myrmecia] bisecta]|uniref:Uncharacterized protein n=1 Tax=[Myrmecia] bisecta TaxID=41462 RepID=A0AAW1P599_9CHLO